VWHWIAFTAPPAPVTEGPEGPEGPAGVEGPAGAMAEYVSYNDGEDAVSAGATWKLLATPDTVTVTLAAAQLVRVHAFMLGRCPGAGPAEVALRLDGADIHKIDNSTAISQSFNATENSVLHLEASEAGGALIYMNTVNAALSKLLGAGMAIWLPAGEHTFALYFRNTAAGAAYASKRRLIVLTSASSTTGWQPVTAVSGQLQVNRTIEAERVGDVIFLRGEAEVIGGNLEGGGALFTLPAGMHPSSLRGPLTVWVGAVARNVQINSAGVVSVSNGGTWPAGQEPSFEGVSFSL